LGPLRYSKEEIEMASQFASKRAQLYVDEAATEKQLKSINLADYRIIHFATHATASDNPANCSLLLSVSDNNDEEDGRVSIKELAELQLNADMVVLSACETARGLDLR